jgi:hypothetical protein
MVARVERYCVAWGASYPSFNIPDFIPLTVPSVSHSSGRAEQQQVIALPHRVVGRAREVDEYLV